MDERRALIEVLLSDARQSNDDIARQLGTDAGEVEALIGELEDAGAIRAYQAVVDWDRIAEERVRAQVELNVELDRETKYDDIAARIAKFPEVESLRLISGDYDFDVEVAGDSMHEVSRFVAEQIAPIPEVTQTVTHLVMTSYKERSVEFGDGEDDDRLSVSP